MPVTPTYPGVYIEEVPSGVRTIVGVATSIAAFIGYFSRGPMNKAVQIFNMGDFQREFGGLHPDSKASYAIQQFFLNGGTTAWVVRTAAAGTYSTASVVLRGDTGDILLAQAGRRLKGESVDDPGEWGNNLRIDIDYNTSDPDNTFNLTVSEVSLKNGREMPVQTETYRNLSMDGQLANYAVEVVNEGSKLIQLERLSDEIDHTRPASTGTSGDLNLALDMLTGNTFGIGSATATIAADASTPEERRRVFQAAVRTAIPTDPALTGATVEITGNRVRVLAGRTGRTYDPETILSFTDISGNSAASMGLVAGTANVQQYKVGSERANSEIPPVWGMQGEGAAGSNGDLPDGAALLGIRDPQKTGLYALEDVDLFNILCIPSAAELEDTEMENVISEAQTYCEERRAFIIVDLPPDVNDMQKARDWLEDKATLRHKNAAAYFPRLRIPDPLKNYRLLSVGASGTVAGLFARTDAARGVWKAPAGIEARLRNVSELDYTLTDMENGQLNPLGLNCLRNFDIYGNVCWGSRTLEGADRMASEWKYIPVRRLALFIEESLFRGTQWVVFEPNDEPLWAQIRLNVGAFMHNLFRQGAFQGMTPREAYFVKCDKETTTQNDIDLGIVNILVGFAPLKPAEFVIIKIQQIAGQIQS
jgi:phage tail sheath protein FI